MSVVVCGAARNVGGTLQSELHVVEKIVECFEEWHVVIVTNDNKDDTNEILSKWASLDSQNRSVIVCEGLADNIPNRIERLSFVRNCYLRKVECLSFVPDFLIIMDLDGLNRELATDRLLDAITGAPPGWGALFANQRTAYYDLYALRRINWVESDVWDNFSKATSWMQAGLFRLIDRILRGRISAKLNSFFKDKHVYALQYKVPENHGYIAVDSAFGGFAIYVYKFVRGGYYSVLDKTSNLQCEHLSFNRIVSRAAGLYICSFMLNDAPPEHLGNASGSPLPSRFE